MISSEIHTHSLMQRFTINFHSCEAVFGCQSCLPTTVCHNNPPLRIASDRYHSLVLSWLPPSNKFVLRPPFNVQEPWKHCWVRPLHVKLSPAGAMKWFLGGGTTWWAALFITGHETESVTPNLWQLSAASWKWIYKKLTQHPAEWLANG